MNFADIEYFTTQELIDELMRRTTFQGVIIHSRDEAKNAQWSGERVFTVRTNANLPTDEAGRLLEVISRHLAACE